MNTLVINIRNAPAGWERDPQFVYIGRPGKGHDGSFGNPFPLTREAARGSTLERYRIWLWNQLNTDLEFRAKVADLHTRTLVCFCAPAPCHGNVLARAAAWLRGVAD